MRPDETITYTPGDGEAETFASAVTPPPGEGAPEPAPVVVFANRFEVQRQLGEGGMGQVFRVRDRHIEGRQVALKILHHRFSDDPRFRGLFFQEVRAGQSFVSEHVVQVRDTGQMEDGRLFLTMDLVEGENLSALLRREHSLDARHALEITRQVLLGLKSGHEKGFVHRDVKPSNVMLRARVPKTERNSFGVHVLILDFGLANLAQELGGGQVAGTPFYMSPEQVRGERLDARSDLFAVGVVLYEMISGSRPFQGKTMHEVTSSVIETDVAPMIESLEHLTPAIRELLERALQKDRDERFQSAGEFVEAIERSKAYRLPRRMAPLLLSIAAAGVCAAAVEGALLWRQMGETARQGGELQRQRGEIARQRLTLDELAGDNRKLEDRHKELQDQHAQVVAGLDQQLAAKQAELERTRTNFEDITAEFQRQMEEVGFELAAATAKLESQEVKGESSDVQARDLQSQVDRIEAQRLESERRAEARISTLETDLRDQAKELTRLREENDKLRQQAYPEALRARGFDVLLALILEGRGVPAWQKYEDLARETLGKGDPHGGDFVEALARSARELALFDDPGAAGSAGDARHLTEAGRALGEAEALLPVLATVGADWLGQAGSSGEARDRLVEARRALDSLRAGLERRRERVSGEHDSAAEELLARIVRAGPEALSQHEARFGCAHAATALERVAGALASELVDAQGRLERRALLASEALDPWGAALAEGRVAPDGEAGRTILGLWLARGWYGKGEARGTSELRARVLGAADSPAAPEEVWRGILALELALEPSPEGTGTLDPLPTHGWPGHLLYRREQAGTVHWLKESARREGDGWQIEREVLSLDPLKPSQRSTSAVKRRGRQYDYHGWILDLAASGAEVRVETWRLDRPAIPAGLAVEHRALAQFQDSIGSEAFPCLVVGVEGIERWISPRLGLVREEKPGTFVKELVYTNARRE